MPNDGPCALMEGYAATPVGATSLPCQQGNRLWLENLSGLNASVAVTIGSETSKILPQTASDPTLLPNTLAGSAGSISIAINGHSCAPIEGLRADLIDRPEDVTVGLVVGRARAAPNPLGGAERGIPVELNAAEADLSQFLPDGMTASNTEIDMVFVGVANEGPGALPPGLHDVDAISDEEADWLAQSLISNTISGVGNEAGAVVAFGRQVRQGSPGQVRTALKEVILNGRFYVKQIATWGGQSAIIFKGAAQSRSFLTAISYGLRNSKMSYLSSYALGMEAVQAPSTATIGRVAQSAAKGNLIGFVIASHADVSEFIQSEDPEKNWGELLGSLGVTFIKVWAAGFTGILIAAGMAMGVLALTGTVVPVALVVSVGVGIAVAAGIGLDWLDNMTGFKAAARRIGHKFGIAVQRGFSAASAFIERISTNAEGIIDGWFQSFSNNLRQNDPNGWCALFCSSPSDQLRAWQRGLTGRSQW